MPDRPETRATAEADSNAIVTVAIAALLATIYLMMLVIGRQPLPAGDLSTAAVVGVVFCLACLVLMVAVLRLQLFSFPLVLGLGLFFFSMSVFVIYPFEGMRAFSGFHVIFEDAAARGLPVVMLAFAALVLGSAAAAARRPAPPPATADRSAAVAAARQTALALYWFFLAVLLLASLRGPGLLTAIAHGYTGGAGFADMRKMGQLSVAVTAPLNWFLPWLSVILLATSRDRRELFRAGLLTALTCGLALLTGDRGTTMVLIALWLQIRHLLGYEVRWRRLFLLGVLASAIILTWPVFRTVPVGEWRPSVLAEALATRFEPDSEDGTPYTTPIGQSLGGMASSYQPIMVACHYVPESEPFRMGSDYLFSVLKSVPFVAGTLAPFLPKSPASWMMDKIDPNFWTGRGFNQIADAYLQGGAVSVVALYVILGWYLTWLWGRLRGEADLRLLAFHSVVVLAIFKWIRNDSGGVGRIVLWAAILVYVLPPLYRWLLMRLAGTPARAGAAARRRPA